MSSGLIVFGLVGYAVFFLWRVRVEKGWAGISALRRSILRTIGGMAEKTRLSETESKKAAPWIYVGVDPGPPFLNGWSNVWVDPDGTLHYEGGR